MTNKYIFWDLDGTVVDSENVDFKTNMFKFASKLLNLEFSLEPPDFIGHEGFSIFTKIINDNKKNINDYNLKYNYWHESAIDYIKQNINEIKPRENVIEIWNEANNIGIRNVIVTSSREDIAIIYLKHIGLNHLCYHYTCLNHISNPKPDPEPYLFTLKKLLVSPENCVVIEDSISGVLSGKAANLFTIAWLNDSYNPKYNISDLITKTLDIDILKLSLQKAYNHITQ